ncbi:MAG: response regulator [Chloroflexi bacterium]|nr:response regulator [Chloroflexota bacterium]
MAGERILIIDDGRESREFIVDYVLNPNGYRPLVASNGEEGLQVVEQHNPDLILLDLEMPRMNGLEFLDVMNERGRDVPTILMTFHGSEEIAIEVYRKGVRDYVKKPFTVEEMEAAILRCLAEVRLRREKEALTERLINSNAELTQRIRELNILYHVGKRVASLVNMDQLLPYVVQAAIEVTSSEGGTLYLLRGDSLVCRARKVNEQDSIHSLNDVTHDPFALQAIRKNGPVNFTPTDTAPHRQKDSTIPASILYTPIVAGERIIGALGVHHHKEDSNGFRKQDGAMLSALSDYVAIAIENATNFAELKRYRDK